MAEGVFRGDAEEVASRVPSEAARGVAVIVFGRSGCSIGWKSGYNQF